MDNTKINILVQTVHGQAVKALKQVQNQLRQVQEQAKRANTGFKALKSGLFGLTAAAAKLDKFLTPAWHSLRGMDQAAAKARTSIGLLNNKYDGLGKTAKGLSAQIATLRNSMKGGAATLEGMSQASVKSQASAQALSSKYAALGKTARTLVAQISTLRKAMKSVSLLTPSGKLDATTRVQIAELRRLTTAYKEVNAERRRTRLELRRLQSGEMNSLIAKLAQVNAAQRTAVAEAKALTATYANAVKPLKFFSASLSGIVRGVSVATKAVTSFGAASLKAVAGIPAAYNTAKAAMVEGLTSRVGLGKDIKNLERLQAEYKETSAVAAAEIEKIRQAKRKLARADNLYGGARMNSIRTQTQNIAMAKKELAVIQAAKRGIRNEIRQTEARINSYATTWESAKTRSINANRQATRAIKTAFETQRRYAAGAAKALHGGFGGVGKIFGALSTQALNLGRQMQWLGRQIEFRLSLPLIFAAGYATKLFLELDKQAVRLRKVYGDGSESAAELEGAFTKIDGAVRDISVTFGVHQAEVMEIAAAWAQAGVELEEGLLALLYETVRASVLTETELESTFKSLKTVMDAYELQVGEVASAINILNRIENETAANFSDLVEVIRLAAPTARQSGVELIELAGMAAALVPAFASAGEAGNSLKSILPRLMAPTAQAKELFTELGIQVDTTGWQMLNAMERFGRLAEAQEQLTDSQRIVTARGVAQLRQISRWIALTDDLSAGLESTSQEVFTFTEAMRNADIADSELFRFMSSPSFQMQALTNELKILAVEIIAPLIPLIIALMRQLRDWARAFQELSPEVKKFIGLAVLFVAVAGPIMGVVGAIVILLASMTTALFKLGAAFIVTAKKMGVFLLMLSKFVKWMALGALASAGTFAKAFVKTSTAVALSMAKMVAAVKAGVISMGLAPFLLKATFVAGLILIAAFVIKNWAPKIVDGFSWVWEQVIRGVNALPPAFGNALRNLARVVASAVKAVWQLLSWLNPFQRHSPSLYENVRNGITAILQEYARLNDLNLDRVTRKLRNFMQIAGGMRVEVDIAEANRRRDLVSEYSPGDLPDYDAGIKALNRLRKEQRRLGKEINRMKAEYDAYGDSIERYRTEMDLASDAITEQERAVDRASEALSRFDDTIAAAEDELRRLQDAASDIESAMSDARAEIDRLARMNITGEYAADTEIFNLEQERKRVQLEMRKIELAFSHMEELPPHVAAEMKRLQGVVDELDLQIDIAGIERDLEFDPLRRQIEELADPIQEMSFGNIIEGIIGQQSILADLEGNLANINVQIANQEDVIRTLNAEREMYVQALEREEEILANMRREYELMEEHLQNMEKNHSNMGDAISAAETRYSDLGEAIRLVGEDVEFFIRQLEEQERIAEEAARAAEAAVAAGAGGGGGPAIPPAGGNVEDWLSAAGLDNIADPDYWQDEIQRINNILANEISGVDLVENLMKGQGMSRQEAENFLAANDVNIEDYATGLFPDLEKEMKRYLGEFEVAIKDKISDVWDGIKDWWDQKSADWGLDRVGEEFNKAINELGANPQWGQLIGAIALVTGGLWLLAAATSGMVSAFALIVGGVIALGVHFGYFQSTMDNLKGAWERLKSAASQFVESAGGMNNILTVLGFVIGGVLVAFFALAHPIMAVILVLVALEAKWGLVSLAIEGLAAVIEYISPLLGGAVQVLAGLLEIVVGLVTLNWDTIKSGLGRVWEGLVEIGEWFGQLGSDILDAIVDAARYVWRNRSDIWDWIRNTFTRMAGRIGGWLADIGGALLGAIVDAAQWVWRNRSRIANEVGKIAGAIAGFIIGGLVGLGALLVGGVVAALAYVVSNPGEVASKALDVAAFLGGLLMLPVELLFDGIIGAGKWLWENKGQIGSTIGTQLEGAMGVLVDILLLPFTIGGPFFVGIMDGLTGAFNDGLDALINSMPSAVKALFEFLGFEFENPTNTVAAEEAMARAQAGMIGAGSSSARHAARANARGAVDAFGNETAQYATHSFRLVRGANAVADEMRRQIRSNFEAVYLANGISADLAQELRNNIIDWYANIRVTPSFTIERQKAIDSLVTGQGWSPQKAAAFIDANMGGGESGAIIGAARGTMIGRGFMTNGPRVLVGEGRRAFPEYVIPTDPRYRSNALTLLQSLSEDIGVAAVASARPTGGASDNSGTTVHFHGDLSFPNITSGDDAELLLENLEAMI